MATVDSIIRGMREQARQHRRAAAVLEEQIARLERVVSAADDGKQAVNKMSAFGALIDAVLGECEDE